MSRHNVPKPPRLDRVLQVGLDAGMRQTLPPMQLLGDVKPEVNDVGAWGDKPGDKAKPHNRAPSYSFGRPRARVAPAPSERRRRNPGASDLEVVRESIEIQTEILDRVDRNVQTLISLTDDQDRAEENFHPIIFNLYRKSCASFGVISSILMPSNIP